MPPTLTTYQEYSLHHVLDYFAKGCELPNGERWAFANPWTAYVDTAKGVVIFKLMTTVDDSKGGGQ